MPRLDVMIERLLAQPVGCIFVINASHHVKIAHLELSLFKAAWRYFIDVDHSDPLDAKGIINQIGKWPGGGATSLGEMPCWLQGRQKPPELESWRQETLVNVCKREHLDARTDGGARLAQTPRIPNPITRNRKFLLWVTSGASVPSGTMADRVRDLLGLVHHTKGAELVLIRFAAGKTDQLHRPTALESGANSRFRAVCEQEWIARQSSEHATHMGMSVDLERVRDSRKPISGVAEAVTLADERLISQRFDEWPLGPVGHEGAGDDAFDHHYQTEIRNGLTLSDMRDFLKTSYMVP